MNAIQTALLVQTACFAFPAICVGFVVFVVRSRRKESVR